jgi:outer membrane protein TolC
MPPRKLIDAARSIEQLPLLENRLTDMKNEIQKVEDRKQCGMIELDQVHARIAIAKQELNSYNAALSSKKAEISDLLGHKHQLERINAREKGRHGITDNQLIDMWIK